MRKESGETMLRLIALDLDGTLLNDAKQITEANRAALDGALERGHDVVITTGRPLRGKATDSQAASKEE